jgi:hypothetical protein
LVTVSFFFLSFVVFFLFYFFCLANFYAQTQAANLSFARAEYLEGQDLIFLLVPGNSLSINDAGFHPFTQHTWETPNNVWVLARVVLRVTTVDANLSAFQHMNLKKKTTES